MLAAVAPPTPLEKASPSLSNDPATQLQNSVNGTQALFTRLRSAALSGQLRCSLTSRGVERRSPVFVAMKILLNPFDLVLIDSIRF